MFSLEREELEFLRIANLSDAVFAIAMTLLVLTFQVPDVEDLGRKLLDQHDQLLAYVISFAVIGRYWLSHHRLFGYLARADGVFMGVNLTYLAAIAFVPFPTELIGRYGGETPALITYAVAMTLASALSAGLWLVADRRGLIAEPVQQHFDRSLHLRAFVPTAVFAVSIPLAVLAPRAVLYVWLVLLVARRSAHTRIPDR